MKESLAEEKSYAFAIRIVKLYNHLLSKKKNYGLGDQVMRSGTSIGANISEGRYAQSKADFIAKYQFSLKEASETRYWLRLLRDWDYITPESAASILGDCDELIRMLTSSINTAKKSKEK